MAINNAINQYPIVDALLGSWTPGAGTITSADSILTAMQKISGSSVSLSGNNVWTGTNSFGNTVTFSALTASTVPYLDASKNLTSSAVTPTELGYVSGVTSAIQTQLNAKAPTANPTFTGTVTIPTPFTLGVVSVTTTGTQLNYINIATGTTGTGNIVFSASPTLTGDVGISGRVIFSGDQSFTTASANGYAYRNATLGLVLYGAGTMDDLHFANKNGGSAAGIPTGTTTMKFYDDIIITEQKYIKDSVQPTYNYLQLRNSAGNMVTASQVGMYFVLDVDNTNVGSFNICDQSTSTIVFSVDYTGACSMVGSLVVGGSATATAVGLEIGNTAGGTPYIDFKSSAVDYNVRIINGTSTTLSFLGATGGYFFDTTVNSIYAKVATTANATITTITQGLTIAGNLVTSAYVADGYTAGLTWSSTDDNASKPKAGIFSKTTGAGTYLYFGTSNSYVTGITTSSSIGPNGELEIGSVSTSGKIQIGSTAPTLSAGSALTINTDVTTGAAGSASIMIQGSSNKERLVMVSAGGGAFINMFSHAGSIASPTATLNGYIISGLSGGGYKTTGYSGNNYVFLQYATENWTDTATGCYTAFFTVPNGSTSLTGRLLINHDGAVTLGSSFGTGTGALYAGAGTFTGLLTTVASATGSAGLRIPHGAAPSSPVNGDIWTTTAGLYVRINGVTIGPLS